MTTTNALEGTGLAEQLLKLLEAFDLKRADEVALAAAIELAIRAAELLVLGKLAPVADRYPATIQALMTVPEPAVEPARDAALRTPDFLGWLEMMDLMCDETLPCLAPGLHRGWQDKTQSCRQARTVTDEALGERIDAALCSELLVGLALRNRVFVSPPPVVLDAREIRSALGALLGLIERLAAGEHAPLAARVAQLRSQSSP